VVERLPTERLRGGVGGHLTLRHLGPGAPVAGCDGHAVTVGDEPYDRGMADDLDPLGSPDLSGGTAVLERTETSDGSGDHERFAHYVEKERIVESAVMGTPVRALCGKVWVPGRDPNKFPVCPDCQRIYEGLPEGPSGD
jgi:hypothetical protein